MQVTITPSVLRGSVTAPASKSAMQRACAAALLKGGETVLHNPGISNDDKAALEIIQQLGATVTQNADTITIQSKGIQPIANEIHCGESGLSVRLFTAIAAISNQPITITGSGSLLKRPLEFFNEVFPQLGVQCDSNNGLLPLKIKGPLVPQNIEVDGSLSSQFLTGLLFAYSASGASNVTITVKNLNSKPYIDLTLRVMEDFGLPLPVNDDYKSFHFRSKAETKMASDPLHYSVEADWSGAAFLLAAGAITKSYRSVSIAGLDIYSIQADKAFLQALFQAEAKISITEECIEVSQSRLKAFHFNAIHCPDLFPPLVALAAYCDGISVIEGVHRLTHKESNRAITLQKEFGKMGVEIKLQDDLMIVEGGAIIKAANVHSHHDHRIAMACAVAALGAEGDVTIDVAEAVNKSYPHFWEHLQQLSVQIAIKNH